MNKLKLYALIIIGLYFLSVLINMLVFDFWETENHKVYLIGKFISQLIFGISIVWSIINGIRIIKSLVLKQLEKWKWTIINFIPLIIVLTSLLFIPELFK